MTVPVLLAFANQYPDVKLTMVSRPFFKPFFDKIPNLTYFEFDANGRHKGFFGLIRLTSDLRKQKIDAFADLHNVLRSKIVTALLSAVGIKTATVDKARAEKKALTRTENKVFKPLKPITHRHAEVFAQLGFPISLHATLPKLELQQNVTVITGEKESLKWIGIAPFAQYDSKVYPLDLMQQVVDELATEKSFRVFLFGGKQEIPTLEKIASNNQNVIVVAGELNLKDELQLISNLDVMLSMDSGNGHLAAMYGVGVVNLWGATHPFTGFTPFNQPIENSLTANREKYPLLPTSVYGNKNVPGYDQAMRTIKPEEVVAKITSLL